jgi:hypothetical protein
MAVNGLKMPGVKLAGKGFLLKLAETASRGFCFELA